MQTESTLGVHSAKRIVNVLGEPGSGKTLYAATASRDPRKIFIIAADPAGLETLSTNKIDIAFRAVSNANPFGDVVKTVMELSKLKPFPYTTVVIDDVSSLQLMVKNWLLVAHKEELTSKKTGAIDTRALFGRLKDRMQTLILIIRDLPCHAVWLAWTKDATTNEHGEIMKLGGPLVEGATSDWLLGFASVNILLRLAKVPGAEGKGIVWKREVRTKPFGGFALKNRIGLPDPMPYDLVPGGNDGPLEWSHGLVDILTWGRKPTTRPAPPLHGALG